MSAFLRQIAAVGVLWALCELLLPGEGLRRPARLTASLLVSALMLSAIGGLSGADWTLLAQEAFDAVPTEASVARETSYREHVLRAQANQLEVRCVRLARKAGYDARVVVRLTADGALDQIRVRLTPDASQSLVNADTLCALLAQALEIEPAKVIALVGGA